MPVKQRYQSYSFPVTNAEINITIPVNFQITKIYHEHKILIMKIITLFMFYLPCTWPQPGTGTKKQRWYFKMLQMLSTLTKKINMCSQVKSFLNTEESKTYFKS